MQNFNAEVFVPISHACSASNIGPRNAAALLALALRFRHLEPLEALRADAVELGRFRQRREGGRLGLDKNSFYGGRQGKKRTSHDHGLIASQQSAAATRPRTQL